MSKIIEVKFTCDVCKGKTHTCTGNPDLASTPKGWTCVGRGVGENKHICIECSSVIANQVAKDSVR